MKSIKKIIKSQRVDMGGIRLDQPLPNEFMDQFDPFLLIHHWNDPLKGDQKQSEVGVGPHPHCGFSPVTLIFKGGVHHRDSRGNNSIVTAGGTQWMFAGKGITHSERPTKELVENGGEFELIQFWVNVPAKDKMKEPYYTPITKNETPVFVIEDEKVKVKIVSGEFKNIKGIIQHFTPVITLVFKFEKEGEIDFEIPAEYNTLIYVLDGELEINNSEIAKDKTLTCFNNDGESIKLKANQNTNAILLAGKPINEEVVTYGPFVLNNHNQVLQALRDAQTGKMGVLIEEF
jgi:quercetin 2,3-dioxygenase